MCYCNFSFTFTFGSTRPLKIALPVSTSSLQDFNFRERQSPPHTLFLLFHSPSVPCPCHHHQKRRKSKDHAKREQVSKQRGLLFKFPFPWNNHKNDKILEKTEQESGHQKMKAVIPKRQETNKVNLKHAPVYCVERRRRRMIPGDSLGWGDGDECLGTQVGQSSQNRATSAYWKHTEHKIN